MQTVNNILQQKLSKQELSLVYKYLIPWLQKQSLSTNQKELNTIISCLNRSSNTTSGSNL